MFSLSGKGKRAVDAELGGYAGGAARTRLELDRQGETPVANMPSEPRIATTRQVHRGGPDSASSEARQSLLKNRTILKGLRAFRSFGRPRALRKRFGETWEGFFLFLNSLFLDRQGEKAIVSIPREP